MASRPVLKTGQLVNCSTSKSKTAEQLNHGVRQGETFKLTKMKKILLVLFVGISIILPSCKKGNSKNELFKQDDERRITKLKQQFKIDAFNIEATKDQSELIIASSESNSKLFKAFKNNLNKSAIKLFINYKENITLAVFEFNDSKEKLFAIKGRFIKKSILIRKRGGCWQK